jgi:predicted nucleotidyltransferase
MLEILFSSKTRVEVLKLFLFNPQNSFYQRQISLLTHQPIRGVQREVIKLEKIGLLEKSVDGNRIYYKANRNCSIFEPLQEFFLKSEGIAEVLKADLEEKENIQIAFIYGSYAKGQENLLSDIDLMVIGNITSKELSSILSKPKRELFREINYVVFPPKEIRERVRKNDHFIESVLKDKKIFIVSNEDGLKAIAQSGQTKAS